MRLNLKLNKIIKPILKNEIDDLKVKIGLEIHARILSRTKIFSDADCYDLANSPVNSNVAYFDVAFPGTMPTLNRKCVEAGLSTSLALNCHINAISYFERKHYFYADLPAGYQITQEKRPIAFNGNFQYPVINPKTHKLTYKSCRIRRIQLEHDSARSLHIGDFDFKFNDNNNQKIPSTAMLIDLNRAGIGLMEIVTEPDLESAFDCYSFTRELALVLRSIGTCSALMNDGAFRVDVNVSVHKQDNSTDPPTLLPGVRVELKNLNSFASVLKATEYEIKRQKIMINENKTIHMETRTYDSNLNKTISIRSKEDQYDYRFMPEPNLLPLVVYPSRTFKPVYVNEKNAYECENNARFLFDKYYLNKLDEFKFDDNINVDLDKVRDEFNMKTLPQIRRNKLIENYGLTHENAFVFVANDLDKILFEIISLSDDNDKEYAKKCVGILLFEYLNQLNKNSDRLDKYDFKLKCRKIKSYIDVMNENLISKRIKYKFFGELFDEENTNKMAIDMIKERNLFIVNDVDLIQSKIDYLFELNKKACDEYAKKEKKREKIFDFFVGRVHKELNELADQTLVDKMVDESLKKLLK
jgi:aspartyl-tRNA(Asn)/glutamyl-tRNA(Gln) amidotransferase subunit B